MKPLPGTDRRVFLTEVLFLTEVPDRELPRSMPAMTLLPASNRPGVTHDRTANAEAARRCPWRRRQGPRRRTSGDPASLVLPSGDPGRPRPRSAASRARTPPQALASTGAASFRTHLGIVSLPLPVRTYVDRVVPLHHLSLDGEQVMTDARHKGSAPTEGGGCPRRRCPRAGRVIAQVKISDLVCRRGVLLVGGEPTHRTADFVPALNVREDPDIGRLAHARHFPY